jgi:predicted nucleic acid-binding protein
MEHLINAFTPIPLNAAGLIQAYADLDAYSRTVGRRMGKNDLWIAATARVTGAKLLTADADFDHLTPAFLDRDLIP